MAEDGSREGFPGGANYKEPGCQCKRWTTRGFDPWVGKSPWRRKQHPAPAFSLGRSQAQSSLEGYSPYGCKSRTRLKRLSRSAHTGARKGLQSEREAGRSEAGLTRSPMRLHLDGPSTHSLKRSSGERQRRQNPDTVHTSLCCYNTTSCEHSDSKLLPTEQACSPLGRFLWLSWEQLVFMTEELSVNTYPFC